MTGRLHKPKPAEATPESAGKGEKHVDQLLDEALEETFPASDAVAILQPVPDPAAVEAEEDKHNK